jgi:acyl-CoA hydrolase
MTLTVRFAGSVDSFGSVVTRVALAALALAIALVGAPGCGGKREAALPAGATVVVLGDSITAGYGVDTADAWPARLAERTGWRVTAAGVSGDRTAGGRARLPALLEDNAPAALIIELGGNDMLRGVADDEIVANLDAMIEAAAGRGAKVVLMAVPRPNALGALTGLSAATFYRDLAKRRGVALVEKALPAVLSDARLKQDALHPTAEGHRALADRTVDELTAIGLVARR